jgi:hypothetical protein
MLRVLPQDVAAVAWLVLVVSAGAWRWSKLLIGACSPSKTKLWNSLRED